MRQSNLHDASKHKFYALTFPNNLTVEQSANFWNSVASTFAPPKSLLERAARALAEETSERTVVIELRSDKHGLIHRLGIPWQQSALLDKLRGHIQGIHTEEKPLRVQPKWQYAQEVGLSDRTRMLDVERIQAVTTSVLMGMAHDVKDGDNIAIQLVIHPSGRSRQVPDTKPVRTSSWAVHALVNGFTAGKDELAERRAKLTQNQFRVVIRFVAASSTRTRAKWLVGNVKSSYLELNSSTAHLRPTDTRQPKVIDRFNSATGTVVYPAQVNTSELIALSAWPIGAPMIGGLTLGKTRYLPASELIDKNGRRLGLSYQDRPIAISAEAACRHMYVIGPSGYGKTTLLTNTFQQDVERGYGAIVIESKGDLFQATKDAIPRERLNDVVVMDLTDHEHPVGLNLLHEGDPRVVVDDLTRLFMNGASDGIYLPEILYHGFHTLQHFPQLTVIDLLPFIQPRTPNEKAWREHLIDQLPKGGEFHSYWKGFDQLKPAEQTQKIRPVVNRMWQLTNRRDVRNMLGQSESTINLKEIMRENKILLIYIPDSIGDETVSLLSSLIVSNIWDAVRSVQKEKPTYLYMDEVQRFLNLPIDLADMLSLARSYKLGLVMAHQYTSQLTPQLFAAITNASTQIAFKLDGPDAARMQNLMGKSVTAEDFMNLGAYEVIGRVATEGGSSGPTYFRTMPQFKPHGYASEVVRRSREQFSRPAATVDKEILRRRSAPSKPVKQRPTFGDIEKDDE